MKSKNTLKQDLEMPVSARRERTRLLKVTFLFSLFLLLGLITLASACAKAPSAPSPAPPTTAPVIPAPAPVTQSEGANLYTQKCAVCHGANGEGTAVGPAVAGHSMAATMTQMRNPMGKMPAFPAGQLSDHEADEIAEFIASLVEAAAPVQEWEKQAPETIHHWMALLSIKSDDAEDARHHLQDALTFITEPTKKAQMEEVLNMMAQGNMHDAEHEIEEMAGSESPSGISMQRFHLILAQRWVEAESSAQVKHHLDHFIVKASAAENEVVHEALELVEKGDFHEAEHEIEELIEMSK